MPPFNHDSRMRFPLKMRLKKVRPALIKIGVLGFFLMLVSNCATQRMIGNEFIHSNKGYAFVLPGVDWEIDQDAWRNLYCYG